MIGDVIPSRSSCLIDGIDKLIKDLKIVQVFIGGDDQHLRLSEGSAIVIFLLLGKLFLFLSVRFPQLPRLFEFSKNVGKNHGRILGRFTDITDLLAAQRIRPLWTALFIGVLESRGDPSFRVGEYRPDIFVGWVPLNVVEKPSAAAG